MPHACMHMHMCMWSACSRLTPMTQVITRKSGELEVLADITLEYKLSIGNHLDSLRWSPDGSALAITATDGYVWWYNITDTRP